MKPLTLEASGYRLYQNLRLDFTDGVTAIVGENGSGKSSITDGILLALFAARGELGQWITNGQDDLLLQLEFEHAGDTYRVRRTARRGKGQTLDLEQLDGEELPDALAGWKSLSRETAAETQKAIEGLLGLSRETFAASAFCGQGAGARFCEADPRERKTILSEILGLDVWPRLLDHARTDLRATEQELAVVGERARAAEEIVAEKEQREQDERSITIGVAAHEQELARNEASLADTLARQQAASVCVAELTAAQAELVAARQAHDRLEQIRVDSDQAATDLAGVRARIVELDPVASRLAALEADRAELDHAREAWQRRKTARAEMLVEADSIERNAARLADAVEACTREEDRVEAMLEQLDEHEATCDRCGQTLDVDAREQARGSLNRELSANGQRARALIAEAAALPPHGPLRRAAEEFDVTEPEGWADLAAREAEARQAALTLAGLRERAGNLEQRAQQASDPTFQTTLEHAQEAYTDTQLKLHELTEQPVPDLEELERQARARQGRVREERARLDAARAELAVARDRLQAVEQAEEALSQISVEVTALHARVDLLKLAEKAYGRDGIPALILENAAIPQIETEASRILEELGTPYRVELRTQRALKTGGVGEALDIVVLTPEGDRDYATFSGGERTRLNLALRIALARLLAHRRGAESRLLAIDEPDGLDADGFERLAGVLRGLGGDFDCILCISHHPDLAHAFDQAITVVKDGGRSRVETGAPAEPVAA